MKNTTKKIFISYRVQDTAGETGRLVDALKQHFADEQIFMDIENLEPGADYTVAIEKSLDSCDVFLAIIGPHWLGDRDNATLRINEPNDWVRMEVSTALHRDIHVVPVLVDGGTLPKPEQLPADLQALLRRQSIEITNKRWRYDTDQLIDFLIKSVGIPPLKAPHSPSSIQDLKKKRTWLYIGAGFILAIISLAVLGYYMEKNKKTGNNAEDSPNNEKHTVSTPLVDSSGNRSVTPTGTNETSAYESVSGSWQEVDEGLTSIFVLTQSGSHLNVRVDMSGQTISTGTGEINRNQVELNFNLFGSPTVLQATLSDDKQTLNGTYTLQANGTVESILLRKLK